MGKAVIDLIGELVEISGNAMIDSIVFAIIGIISLSVAFGLVGRIFDAIGLYDSDLMSDVHWTIRVGVFVGLTYIAVKIAQFIKWLFSFQWWVYAIAGVVFVGIIFFIYYIKHCISKRKSLQTIPLEEIKNDEIIPEVVDTPKTMVIDSRNYCPRCHSKLVKRHGPYGDFYGCEAYGQTGCRYTRKFL